MNATSSCTLTVTTNLTLNGSQGPLHTHQINPYLHSSIHNHRFNYLSILPPWYAVQDMYKAVRVFRWMGFSWPPAGRMDTAAGLCMHWRVAQFQEALSMVTVQPYIHTPFNGSNKMLFRHVTHVGLVAARSLVTRDPRRMTWERICRGCTAPSANLVRCTQHSLVDY